MEFIRITAKIALVHCSVMNISLPVGLSSINLKFNSHILQFPTFLAHLKWHSPIQTVTSNNIQSQNFTVISQQKTTNFH